MKKLLTAFFVLATCSLSAQTIFHYGKDSVSVNEFLRAYSKNNTGVRTEKGLRDYLDLYIASRLKIKEAKEEGYDTIPQIAADLENLRGQILQAYKNDKSGVDRLVDEAFTRSQKNIHLAHIFIRSGNDSILAERKKQEVLDALKTKEFSEVAAKYSDDPSAKSNGGNLGWIAVFSLPYELENLAYTTPVGKNSVVYKSRAGYHIFRNLGERRDMGRMKAAQILLAFPPDADVGYKKELKKLADSIYLRLKKGDDFGKLASQFSNDIVSAAAKGQMQEFGTGQYEPAFESVAFSLQQDGAISKPFLSSYGYHIVKRISKSPASTIKDEKTLAALKDKVEQSDRINTLKSQLAAKVKKQAGFKQLPAGASAELFGYTDSVLLAIRTGKSFTINSHTPLLQVGKDQYLVQDWFNHVQMNRYKPDGISVRNYDELWPEFTDAMAIKYYEDHLEDFNEDFKQQLTEFSEGNLFFEIMQRKVWGPAQSDSTALLNYYNQHKADYNWKHSANAVVFYASDLPSAKEFLKDLKKDPAHWQKAVEEHSSNIAADSARIELAQLPNPTRMPLKNGVITNPLVNQNDHTASFAMVLKTFDKTEPRSFEEARGLVINNYQDELEKKWIAELKKKYPVRINQQVLEEIIRNKKY